MKTALILACAALGLAGCATSDHGYSGSAGPPTETEAGTGRAAGMQNDLGINDPRGAFQNWRFGGDPDRTPPRIPVENSPDATAVVPEPAPDTTLPQGGTPNVTFQHETTPQPEPPRSIFESFRYGTGDDPDRIAPLLPVDPEFPPSQTPVRPLVPGP
jgi:hypothetical protein